MRILHLWILRRFIYVLSEEIARDILKKCIGIGTRKIPKCKESEMNIQHVDHALIYDFTECFYLFKRRSQHCIAIARLVKYMTNSNSSISLAMTKLFILNANSCNCTERVDGLRFAKESQLFGQLFCGIQ